MGFDTNDIQTKDGSIVGGNNKKTISVTLDGDYISTSSHPAWGVLGFRTVIGKLSSYFKTGVTLWAIISVSIKTGAGIGRFYYKDEINGVNYGLWDLDIVNITWQDTTKVRITFPASTDLSKVYIGETFRVDGAGNASNDGQHEILDVVDGSDYIDVEILARTDDTDDEIGSPGTGETGSVTQFTNTSFQVITSKPFKITENTYNRIRLNKTSGSGATINSYELVIFTKD